MLRPGRESSEETTETVRVAAPYRRLLQGDQAATQHSQRVSRGRLEHDNFAADETENGRRNTGGRSWLQY